MKDLKYLLAKTLFANLGFIPGKIGKAAVSHKSFNIGSLKSKEDSVIKEYPIYYGCIEDKIKALVCAVGNDPTEIYCILSSGDEIIGVASTWEESDFDPNWNLLIENQWVGLPLYAILQVTSVIEAATYEGLPWQPGTANKQYDELHKHLISLIKIV